MNRNETVQQVLTTQSLQGNSLDCFLQVLEEEFVELHPETVVWVGEVNQPFQQWLEEVPTATEAAELQQRVAEFAELAWQEKMEREP